MKSGSFSPTNPMNAWSTSTAHSPQPRIAIVVMLKSTNASLASRVIVDGKCSITTGSAFSAANGSRSSSRH